MALLQWRSDSCNLVDELQLPWEWYLSNCIVSYVKFYGREIMVWGCLSGVGLGPIMPVKGTFCCGNSVGIAPFCSIRTAQQTVRKARSIKACLTLSCLKPFFNLPHWSAHNENVQGNRCLHLSHVCKASQLLMEQLQVLFSGHTSGSAVYMPYHATATSLKQLML